MSAAGADLIEEIRGALPAAGDPERAIAQQRYMRSALPFHGVPLPQVRRIVTAVLREPGRAPADRDEWEAAVRDLWDHATHREERYAALALTADRHARAWQDPDAMGLYEHLVRTGAWWDYVDEIAARRVGPILAAHPHTETVRMRAWATGDDLWIRRTSILCQLRAGADADLALLTHAIDHNVEGTAFGSQFFIRKAIGWALQQHARVDPHWVREFIASRSDVLAPLSVREAVKHL